MPVTTLPHQTRITPMRQRKWYVNLTLCAALTLTSAHASDPIHSTRDALRHAIIAAKAASKPAALKREDFLRLPPISDVKLSADGRYLVYRQRKLQQTDLMLQDLHSNHQTRLLADIRQLQIEWADSNTLWLADNQGIARYTLSSRSSKRLLKWDEKREQTWWGVDAHSPHHALLREKVAHNGVWQYRAVQIDRAGKSHLLLAAAQPLRGLLLNQDGTLAYASIYDGARYDTVIRRYEQNHDAAATNGQEILRCTGTEYCNLIGHDEAKRALWLLTQHGEDRSTLKRWQPDETSVGRWHTEHRDPSALADVASLLWQPGRNDWLGIAYHPDRRHWYGRDANQSKALTALQQQLPQASLTLSTSADGARWLVQAKHAQWELDQYYLYTPARSALQPLFADEYQRYKALMPNQLAPAVPLHYRARDGLLVHGYVYLPLGIDPGKAPLIAHIHGGPFNRDRDHFNAIPQLLVNRGYAVFTPNFRSSTGYGQPYMQASNGDFGNAAVLHDILDGMDFLLANGVGDRNKQAVSGHSFGGYASLLAVSHQPHRFRYAVATAAPVDFNWVMQEIADNGGSGLPKDSPPGEIYLSHHGLRFDDKPLREKMRRESPLALIETLQTPIYLWAGARDDRVPLKSLTHYAGEAKRLHKAVTLLIDPDAGHSPEAAVNLDALVYLLESAAATHFGGELSAPSERLQQFLRKNTRLAASQ